jgi:hypothetical protein
MSSPERPLRYRRAGQPPPGIHSLRQVRRINEVIAQDGFWIQAIHGDGPETTYAYTVGLDRIGHPELIVTGMGCPSACNLLTVVAHPVVEHGMRWSAGMLLDLGAPIAGLIEVARPGWWLAIARELSQSSVSALQIVLSDDELRLPGTPAFDDCFAQPILGNVPWTVPGWQSPEIVAIFQPPTEGGDSAAVPPE